MRSAAVLMFLALAVAAETPRGVEVRFLLVPLERWNEGRPAREDLLPEGLVRLYRQGEYEPTLEIPANTFAAVPPGTWYWIAEAPGFVSAGSGTLVVAGSPQAPKTLLWPVLPACRITLGEPRGWLGVERVDFVSFDHAATYPVAPARRREVALPAGRFLAYAVGPRGLVGFTRPRECRAGQELALRTLDPPPADREQLLVHVELPPGVEIPASDLDLTVRDPRGGTPATAPLATVRSPGRQSFFFDLAVADDREIVLEHPGLRTQRRGHDAVGGRALELPPLRAKPRRTASFLIDYRPRMPHPGARVVLSACGAKSFPHALQDSSECRGTALERPLEEGLHEYAFPELDDGQYLVEAVFDEQRIPGLGHNLLPHLLADTDDDLLLGPVLLQELEIHGHLLVDGEPVAGEVRFSGVTAGGKTRQVFPTDEDLVYHWTFFGYRFRPRQQELAAEAARLLTTEDLGLYHFDELAACDSEGACRSFNIHSTFTGEGRWDIDLGSRSVLFLEVTDAEDGRPVPGALVVTAPEPAVHFVRGRVFAALPEGIEGQPLFTDHDGRVRVRLPKSTDFGFVVTASGYRVSRHRLAAAPGADTPFPVALERQGGGVHRLLLPGNRPLAGAFLLAIDTSGRRRPECCAATARDGSVDLRPPCLATMSFVVMHPAAALQTLDGPEWRSTEAREVFPAPDPPWRLRLVDPNGRPLPGLPIDVRLGGLRLSYNDFLLATSRGVPPLLTPTDARGEIALVGLDPRRGPVAVGLPGEEGIAISAADPVVEIVIAPP